jgi:hypothetical protein
LVPDESTQDRDNSRLVATGVVHQALEGVDAPKPDIDRSGPKVGDCGVVTVSDLPLFGGVLPLSGDLRLVLAISTWFFVALIVG